MKSLRRTMLAGALALAFAAIGPVSAQVVPSGPLVERGEGLTHVQYYERERRFEDRRRFRDGDDDDDDRRSRRSQRDEYGQGGGYGGREDGYGGRDGGYRGRGNPYAQRGNGGNLCVTARGNCALYAPQPAASPCSCDIPGFGEKRGAVAAGGGGAASFGRRGYDGGGNDSSSGVIVRRGY